jgi:hypothetical protein
MTPKIHFLIILTLIVNSVSAQYLSNLQAVKTDAIYTTYAASPERSHYKTDQGYQFQWFDDESGAEFISTNGPNFGIAFNNDNRLIIKLNELFREPVITASYSDLVKYFYYPVKDLRMEVFFAVYSSETVVLQYRFFNESHFPVLFTAIPYVYYPSNDSTLDITHQSLSGNYTFPLQKKPDNWMREHNIPVAGNLTGYLKPGINFDSVSTFLIKPGKTGSGHSQLKQPMGRHLRSAAFIKGINGYRSYRLQPGESTSFRVAFNLSGEQPPANFSQDYDLEKLIRDNELAYSKIPELHFTDKDKEMLYWNSFSLMRQCMMPPEGECRNNYYVFSREPKWGWGYGGQVFHESLVMLAYAYMDPQGAMNSQRVFMDRQRPDGYINYRTGPYLNETIETNGKPTSSAPWFNYENLEIYKITGDRKFLKEAYNSGQKFYRYYVARRDSNNNGLCEWGAHAELESVRDARVAVWDNVGWASGFEGPDNNSMLVMEAKSLAEMAKIMGLIKESAMWQEDADRRSFLINKTLWDPQSEFYYNVNKKDLSFSYKSPDDLKIKEIIGFLPLWAGVADAGKAKFLVKKMLDTSEFCRPYGIPSLSAANRYYCPIGYWNGPVWVQWNYLIFRGLRDYGYVNEANQLKNRILDNMIYHLKKDHTFWEFYSADDHQAGWNKTYIWAGIAARFLIDSGKE